MSEMIERVARAMREFIETPLPNNTIPPTMIDLTVVSAGSLECVWEMLAKAAIAAMREPTEEMVYEAQAQRGHQDAESCWSAMIDAALK